MGLSDGAGGSKILIFQPFNSARIQGETIFINFLINFVVSGEFIESWCGIRVAVLGIGIIALGVSEVELGRFLLTVLSEWESGSNSFARLVKISLQNRLFSNKNTKKEGERKSKSIGLK